MRRVRSVVALGLLLSIGAMRASAVGLDEKLRGLLDQALSVNITARVVENGHETIHSYELTRVTILGRGVRLRLEGGNLIVLAEFTPYESADGILLVAEGQILLRTPDNEEIQYRTSLRSIPVAVGERVVFYPLGRSTFDMDLTSDHSSSLTIELEVEIHPYHASEG